MHSSKSRTSNSSKLSSASSTSGTKDNKNISTTSSKPNTRQVPTRSKLILIIIIFTCYKIKTIMHPQIQQI